MTSRDSHWLSGAEVQGRPRLPAFAIVAVASRMPAANSAILVMEVSIADATTWGSARGLKRVMDSGGALWSMSVTGQRPIGSGGWTRPAVFPSVVLVFASFVTVFSIALTVL